MTELDLFRKQIDLVWSHRKIQEPFENFGKGMNIYSLRRQEDNFKDLKQKLKEIKKHLILVEDADELKKEEPI